MMVLVDDDGSARKRTWDCQMREVNMFTLSATALLMVGLLAMNCHWLLPTLFAML